MSRRPNYSRAAYPFTHVGLTTNPWPRSRVRRPAASPAAKVKAPPKVEAPKPPALSPERAAARLVLREAAKRRMTAEADRRRASWKLP